MAANTSLDPAYSLPSLPPHITKVVPTHIRLRWRPGSTAPSSAFIDVDQRKADPVCSFLLESHSDFALETLSCAGRRLCAPADAAD
jgi:hypothetical protein